MQQLKHIIFQNLLNEPRTLVHIVCMGSHHRQAAGLGDRTHGEQD